MFHKIYYLIKKSKFELNLYLRPMDPFKTRNYMEIQDIFFQKENTPL